MRKRPPNERKWMKKLDPSPTEMGRKKGPPCFATPHQVIKEHFLSGCDAVVSLNIIRVLKLSQKLVDFTLWIL